jgi:hypothetical protein
MGESKRRKQLNPNYGKVRLLSPEAVENAEKRLAIQAKFNETWGKFLDSVECGVIESWEPMEVELACIQTGVFDNICSPFNLPEEIKTLNEYISRGELYRSLFHIAREAIYTIILSSRRGIEEGCGFSAPMRKNIILAFKDLNSFNGDEAVEHKEVWKYIPSDAQDFLDQIKLHDHMS